MVRNKDIIHKIKSPLTAIFGYADMLQKSIKDKNLQRDNLKWIHYLKKDLEKLSGMIQKLDDVDD